MIELHNVTRRFGEHTVIKGLSHTFPKKGIVALMGASGLGKTTLLRLLAGLDKPDEGEVRNGYPRIAVSFQEPRLIPWMTCEENIKFVLPKHAVDKARITTLLRALELEGAANALPDALSGGMKQRVSLARALAHGGDLLLLDEPFSALDNALKGRLVPLFKNADPEGLTVVITHSEEEAKALGAQILRLDGNPVSALVAEE